MIELTLATIHRTAANRKPGYVAAVLAAAEFNDGHKVTLTAASFRRLRDEFCFSCGPGCQLRRTLSWWGIRDDGSCGCSEYAAKMDRWGVAGCRSRLEEIVQHLREQAAAKGLPWIATAARIAVSRAIDAAASEEATHAEQAQAASQTDVGRPAR